MAKLILIFHIIWSVAIIILNLNGNITFGHGIGDFVYSFLVFLFVLLFYFIYYQIVRNRKEKIWIITYSIIVVLEVLLVILKLTIYRGAEYPWNGKIFLYEL